MNLASTAPHITQAADSAALAGRGPLAHAIEGRPESSGLVLGKRDDGAEPVVEVGLWSCTPGAFRLALAGDELLCVLAGRATYTEHNGETVEAAPGHVIHFPSGWSGRCDVQQSLRASYMKTRAAAMIDRGATPCLLAPEDPGPLRDWGPVPTMIEGQSRTAGLLLHRGPGGFPESGVWTCSPGYWRCHVTRDEFCHFIAGRSSYRHDSGEVIEVAAGTLAFFPKDWRGTCRVHETVRKVYMIA
jgi:uncharacterized protein